MSDEAEKVDGPEAPRRDWFDPLPYVVFLTAAYLLLYPLWSDPAGVVLSDNYQDHVQFEWMLTHGANALVHLGDPFFTPLLNAPNGVNLMANTSVLAWAVPLAPLTLTAGPAVTFALVSTLALAGTAAAWYFVLGKLVRDRAAALVGGAFCGFAPAMISQATGHPNIAAQYVVPFIVWLVLRMRTSGNVLRRGLILAGLIVVQAFINEELLFLTAIALGVFTAGYAVSRPKEVLACAPSALKTLGVAALASFAVLAYPLYRQFFGAMHYRGLPDYIIDGYGTDLASYWSFARRSLVGTETVAARLASGPTEENTFFGSPLLIGLLAIVILLRKDPVVRALAAAAVGFAVASLGVTIKVAGQDTGIYGPWWLLHELPLFDSVVPTRLSLVVTPLVGCLLARALAHAEPAPQRPRKLAYGAVCLALLPLIPTSLPVSFRPAVPVFFTAGTYQQYLPSDGVVFGVPPGWFPAIEAMQWQTATGQDFRIFGGYYLAPNPDDPQGRAMYGPKYPPTAELLTRVAEEGDQPVITDRDRAQARADLAAMDATIVVLRADHPRAVEVRIVLDALIGPGQPVDDVWIWKV